MKTTIPLRLVLAAALVTLSTGVAAQVDDAAAKALMKRNDCGKCHAVNKTKKGPSFQKIAAKFKGKADAEAKMTDNLTKSPKVKLEDGTEEEHKAIDTKDAKERKNLINWILAQ